MLEVQKPIEKTVLPELDLSQFYKGYSSPSARADTAKAAKISCVPSYADAKEEGIYFRFDHKLKTKNF